jgi:hypothetical protein
MNNEPGRPSEIRFRDVAPTIEFGCWVLALLCPILRLVNGPAVTDDQFAIQVALFSLALLGGAGLRLYNYLRQ